MKASCEVAVVGLGPVGAVLCALLGERGIDVIAIEPQVSAAPYPRAIAADDEMLRSILRLPGVSAAADLFDTGQRVEVRDGAGRLITEVGFEGSELGVSGLSFFHQPALERALRAAANSMPSVRMCLGRSVVELRDESDGLRIGFDDGGSVQAKWVVGCDGATSTVRRLLQIPYTGRTFSEPWLVIDIDSPAPLEHLPCFTYVLDRRRPAVNMPRPGGHRFEFMALAGEDPETLAAPESVERLLKPYLAALTSAGRESLHIVRATVYTYHARRAARWREGRILLAGDAAHCMPPFGGQGLGSGIGDAHALAWRLAEVVRGLAPTDVLDQYEAERRPRIAAMTRTALVAGRLLTAQSVAGAAMSTTALRLVDVSPWIGAQFRAGALRPKARRALPNPQIRTRDGARLRLDDVLPAGWALLGFGGDPSLVVSGRTSAALQARGAAFIAVFARGQLASARDAACLAFEDLDGTLLARRPRRTGRPGGGRAPAAAMLVRPDGFVAAVGEGAAIAAALDRLTGSGR